jgi:hypothetical protein
VAAGVSAGPGVLKRTSRPLEDSYSVRSVGAGEMATQAGSVNNRSKAPNGIAKTSSNRLAPNLLVLVSKPTVTKEKQMIESTKDELIGIAHKEAACRLTSNPKLVTGGQTENLAGRVQRKLGQAETMLEQ